VFEIIGEALANTIISGQAGSPSEAGRGGHDGGEIFTINGAVFERSTYFFPNSYVISSLPFRDDNSD
jgi:hypothetical protein